MRRKLFVRLSKASVLPVTLISKGEVEDIFLQELLSAIHLIVQGCIGERGGLSISDDIAADSEDDGTAVKTKFFVNSGPTMRFYYYWRRTPTPHWVLSFPPPTDEKKGRRMKLTGGTVTRWELVVELTEDAEPKIKTEKQPATAMSHIISHYFQPLQNDGRK